MLGVSACEEGQSIASASSNGTLHVWRVEYSTRGNAHGAWQDSVQFFSALTASRLASAAQLLVEQRTAQRRLRLLRTASACHTGPAGDRAVHTRPRVLAGSPCFLIPNQLTITRQPTINSAIPHPPGQAARRTVTQASHLWRRRRRARARCWRFAAGARPRCCTPPSAAACTPGCALCANACSVSWVEGLSRDPGLLETQRAS